MGQSDAWVWMDSIGNQDLSQHSESSVHNYWHDLHTHPGICIFEYPGLSLHLARCISCPRMIRLSPDMLMNMELYIKYRTCVGCSHIAVKGDNPICDQLFGGYGFRL